MAGSHFPHPPPISNTNQNESVSKCAIGNDLNLGLENFPLLPVPSSSLGVNGASKPNPNSCGNGNGHNISSTSASSTKLPSYEEPTSVDGQPTAVFSSGELKSQIEYYESLVVGYFVGKYASFSFCER